MNGFSWLIEGEIGGMARPGHDADRLWKWLAEQGIGLVVSLTESAPDKDAMARHNIESLHIPVPDFTAPRQEDIRRFIEHARFHRHERHAICVHCGAGIGRTGTMLACYLVSQGESASQAILRVRQARPGSVETEEQEAAVRRFAESLTGEQRPRGGKSAQGK